MSATRDPQQIYRDLLERGVTSRFAKALAARLATLSGELDGSGYEAVLGAVCLAFGAHRRGLAGLHKTARDVDEIQRLMEDFSSELRKLDEALETLSAYVLRLRTQSSAAIGDRTLH